MIIDQLITDLSVSTLSVHYFIIYTDTLSISYLRTLGMVADRTTLERLPDAVSLALLKCVSFHYELSSKNLTREQTN